MVQHRVKFCDGFAGESSILVAGERVMRLDQGLEFFIKHVGINLRGRDVRMPKQHLHHPQIGPTGQKMTGKSMAQDVRRDA